MADYLDLYIDGYGENALLAWLQKQELKYSHPNTIDGNVEYNYSSVDYSTKWLGSDAINSYESLPIEIARGCIFKCSFCSFPMNGKKKFDYIRENTNLYEELIYNYENFGTTHYLFSDDTFNDSTYKLELLQELFSRLPFKLRFTCFIKPELLVSAPEQIDILVSMGLLSANYGIESFNKQTRIAIKKMGEVNKVLEKIEEMKNKARKADVLLYNGINMIAGLPYDTPENLEQAHDYIVKSDYIDGCNWYPLYIINNETGTPRRLSPIDKNPEAYGYKVKKIRGASNWVSWQNENMNYKTARTTSAKYLTDNFLHKKVNSFVVPGLMNSGLDIYKFDSERNSYYNSINEIDVNHMQSNIERTIQQYKQHLL